MIPTLSLSKPRLRDVERHVSVTQRADRQVRIQTHVLVTPDPGFLPLTDFVL